MKLRLTILRALLAAAVTLWISEPVVCSAANDSDSFSELQLTTAVDEFRSGLLTKMPMPIFLSLFQEISGDSSDVEKSPYYKAALFLGPMFMRGAVPIILPNSTVAFYNPYCDIFMLATFVVDDTTKLARISGTFVAGGDTLAIANGDHEKFLGPDDINFVDLGFARRVQKRSDLLFKALSTGNAPALRRSLDPIENHARLLKRYLSLGVVMAKLSPLEGRALQEISDALRAGNISTLKADGLAPAESPPFTTENWPEVLRKKYNLVFAAGSESDRIVYLEADDNPTLAVSAELSQKGGKLLLSKLVLMNLKADITTPH